MNAPRRPEAAPINRVTQKRAARNRTIAAFDDALNALRFYLDTYAGSAELTRACGIEPDLRDVRHRFELATAPEAESREGW